MKGIKEAIVKGDAINQAVARHFESSMISAKVQVLSVTQMRTRNGSILFRVKFSETKP